MKRLLKWAGIILATLIVLLALVVGTLNLIPGEKYKSLISSGVKSATGRELAIDGDFDISLFTSLAFKASGIKFANAEWGSQPHMVSVTRIEGDLALFPLLRGILDISLVVDEPDVQLETDDSGQGNWQFGPPVQDNTGTVETDETVESTEQGGGLPIRPRIRKLHLNGIRFAFWDGQSGDQMEIESEKLHLGSENEELAVDINGKFNDIPLALAMGIDNAEFFVDNQPTGIQCDGHFGDVKLKIEGTAGPLTPTFDLDAVLTVNSDSVAAFSPLTDRDLPNVGPLSLSAHFTGKKGKYALYDVLAKLEDETLNVEAKGAIADLNELGGMTLEAKVDTRRLAEILKAFGIQSQYPLPNILNADATAEGNLKNLAVKRFQAKVQGPGLTINSTAQVQNVITLAGVTADVAVETESLDLLADLIQTELPSLGPLKLNANFAGKGEKLGLLEVKADLKGKALHADVAGSVVDPLKLKGVKADLKLGVDSFDWLAEYLKAELPPLGALSASATIVSKEDTFEVKDLKAELADEGIKATVAGSMEDLLKLVGLTADINVDLDSLASLNSLLKQELPVSDAVSLEGKITSKGGLKAPLEIATMVKSDGVTASLTGSIAEPLAVKGIDLALTMEAESMQKVGKLTGTQLQGKDPLKLESKLTAEDNTYELAGLHFKVGELDVKGKAAFTQPSEAGGRPRISGALHVGDLDISKRQAAKRKKAGAEIKNEPDTEEKVEAEKKDKVFSSETLPFGPLKAVDVDLRFTVESLTTQELNLENLTAKLTLDKGFLSLEPLNARIGDGTLVGTAVLDARNSPAALKADIEMKDATFRNFGGKLHFLVDLEGSGNSIADIMASLDGQLMFNVKEATLKKSFMTGFGTSLLDTLNPFDKEKEDTELICAIALFDIKEGVADAKNTIAAQMADVTWFGSGEINLMTEEIGFGMHPKPRKGLGINMGSLAKVLAVGGTLVHPRIVLDPKDIAVKYGKYTAAMATGGVTLAADLLYSKIKANTDVCANILEELDQLQEADEKAEKEKSE